MNRIIKILAIVMLVVFIVGCGKKEEDEQTTLNISAAISLSDALEEVKQLFEAEHDVTLIYQFGGSGKLAQQIEQGAPGDVFISANEQWMDMLIDNELIDEETYTQIISNRLVLVKDVNESLVVEDLTQLSSSSIKQIAIGHPESVPAGAYALMALQNNGNWSEIEEKTILTQDVRQVLTYVETGNAEVGFVYESDATDSEMVDVLAIIDPSLYDPIIYPGGVRTDSQKTELGEEFLRYLTSAQAQEVFKKYGFSELSNGDKNGSN